MRGGAACALSAARVSFGTSTSRLDQRIEGLTLLDTSCLNCDRDDDGMIDTQVANLGFCYCLTVHRAQRSEWPRVAVIDDYLGGDKARLAYAAATRARNTPIWVG